MLKTTLTAIALVAGLATAAHAENWTRSETAAHNKYFGCLLAGQKAGIPAGSNRAAERCAAQAEQVVASCRAADASADCEAMPGMMRSFFVGQMSR